MKKKKKPSLTPKGKKEQKKGLDALKDKNFLLDDEGNDKVRGGFIEYGTGDGSTVKPGKHHPGRHGEHECD